MSTGLRVVSFVFCLNSINELAPQQRITVL